MAHGQPRSRRRPVRLPGAGVDVLRSLIVALIAFNIGRIHQYFPLLAQLRPALLCVGAAAAIAVLTPQVLTKEPLLRTWPSRVVISLALLAVISSIFGLSFGASATYILERYSKVLFFWLLLVLSLRHLRDLKLYVWAFLIGAAFLCYLSIFVYGVVEYYGNATARLDDSAMFMYDPNDIGVLLVTAIPLSLLQFQTSTGWRKWACVILLGGIGWTMALSGSRGGFLGMIVVAMALLFMLRRIPLAKRVGSVVLLAGAMTVAAPPGYWNQMSTILEAEEDYNVTSEDGRVQIWKRGLTYMTDYPFGVGIGNFGRAEGTISSKAKSHEWGTGLVFSAPHNSFIEAGAELGVLGMLLWSSLVVGGFFGMRRLRRSLPPWWADADADRRYAFHATMYMAVAFLGFGATAFFVSFAYLDPIYILAGFTAVLYACVERLRRAEPPRVMRTATAPRPPKLTR